MTSLATASRLVALGLLFSVAPSTASSAWAGDRREANLQEEVKALSALSPSDRKEYFSARRELERKSSDQRQAQLRSLEECLQRSSADRCLEQARQQRKQERSQWRREIAALRQRYQLPTHQARPGQQVWKPGVTSWR